MIWCTHDAHLDLAREKEARDSGSCQWSWRKVVRDKTIYVMYVKHFPCHYFQLSWWSGFKMSHPKADKKYLVDKYTKKSITLAFFYCKLAQYSKINDVLFFEKLKPLWLVCSALFKNYKWLIVLNWRFNYNICSSGSFWSDWYCTHVWDWKIKVSLHSAFMLVFTLRMWQKLTN